MSGSVCTSKMLKIDSLPHPSSVRYHLPISLSFLEDHDVALIPMGEHDNKRNKGWAPVGEETVLAALERIVDSSHYPLLITCSTGKHRTGNCEYDSLFEAI